LVIAKLKGDDVILCQITNHARDDEDSIRLDGADFVAGGLSRSSRIRPNKLFTAAAGIVVYRASQVSNTKLGEVVERVIAIVSEA
jgi:mRNA interferase MazF